MNYVLLGLMCALFLAALAGLGRLFDHIEEFAERKARR